MSDKLYVVYNMIGSRVNPIEIYSRKSRAEKYCKHINSVTNFSLKVCEIDLADIIIKQEGLIDNADNSI